MYSDHIWTMVDNSNLTTAMPFIAEKKKNSTNRWIESTLSRDRHLLNSILFGQAKTK